MITTVVFAPNGNYLGFKSRAADDAERYDNERDVSPEQLGKKEGLRLVKGALHYSLEQHNRHLAARMEAFAATHIEAQAQSMGYTSSLSLMSYAEDDTCLLFQKEARYFRRWRTLVEMKVHELKNLARQESQLLPTVEELVALLPPLNLAELFVPATAPLPAL